MSAQEFPSLVTEAKRGNVDAITALIMTVARDLRAFIATFAASPAMLEEVHAATWMQVRREITACPPTSQVIVWIRQRAMVILQHRLEQERNQAIAAKDGLRHLVAQDGLEGLQALVAPTNDGAAHINKKYSELSEDAQVLIHRRYAENAALDVLAAEAQLSGQAEAAIRLFTARALLHWRATAEDGRAPDDRLFPATIELHIASSIQPDARQQLSLSLLKDLARAAAFARQMRIDMLLRAVFGAYSEDDARVLANSMGQIEHKRRNESSLLQVAAPARMPVGSGSELMRVQDRIADRQSRAPNTPTSHGPGNNGSSPNKRHLGSSDQRSTENHRHRGKRRKPPIAIIGGGVAAIAALILVMIWGFGSGRSDANSTSTAHGKNIATILGFQGDFNLLDGTTQKPGALGMALHAGQGLRISEGEVTVELNENSRLVISAKTEVRAFDRLNDGTGQVQLNNGAMKIQTMATPGLEVSTVQARISFGVARGSITAEGDRTTIQAITGAIVVTAVDGSGSITIPPGATVIALTGAAPKLLLARAFVRGINFGGNLVNIDGQKWLAHRQALSGGLKLADGTNIATVGALSGTGLDYDKKSMLDTGLSATGKPIELTQTAPDGEYDVTLWLGNTTPATASSLSLTINDKKIELSGFYLPRTGWAQIGPITVHNSNKQITMSIEGIGTGRLSGLLLEAPKSDNLVMPPSIQLSSPIDASSFYSNDEFAIQADVVGITKSVQFYAGEILLGEISTPPFRMLVKAPAPGDHKLVAKAINPGMNASISLPLGISVSESFGSGSITFEHWDHVKGRYIADALKDAKVLGKPSKTYTVNKFQANSDAGEYYYARARAYIHPPITGNYVFWITCDDEGQLWLSTDHASENMQMIANSNEHTDSVTTWTKFPTQQSKPISLERGKRYFIEYRLKEAAIYDYGAVGWKLPNGVMDRPISGAHLSPADKP